MTWDETRRGKSLRLPLVLNYSTSGIRAEWVPVCGCVHNVCGMGMGTAWMDGWIRAKRAKALPI